MTPVTKADPGQSGCVATPAALLTHPETQAKTHAGSTPSCRPIQCPPPAGKEHGIQGLLGPGHAWEKARQFCSRAQSTATLMTLLLSTGLWGCLSLSRSPGLEQKALGHQVPSLSPHTCTYTQARRRAHAGMQTLTHCMYTQIHRCAHTCTPAGKHRHTPSSKWLIIAVKKKYIQL